MTNMLEYRFDQKVNKEKDVSDAEKPENGKSIIGIYYKKNSYLLIY